MPQNTIIRKALSEDVPILYALGEEEKEGYFEQAFEEQKQGKRYIFIAQHEGRDAGFCFYNKNPKYALFQKLKIPEIQDLFVQHSYRRQGVAKSLILHCESLARKECYDLIGMGVGLLSSFGAAQKLYITMGYVPDGHGLVYDRDPVRAGEIRPIDNELCLMMVKEL